MKFSAKGKREKEELGKVVSTYSSSSCDEIMVCVCECFREVEVSVLYRNRQ